MDDVLLKPFRKQAMLDMLAKYTPKGSLMDMTAHADAHAYNVRCLFVQQIPLCPQRRLYRRLMRPAVAVAEWWRRATNRAATTVKLSRFHRVIVPWCRRARLPHH